MDQFTLHWLTELCSNVTATVDAAVFEYAATDRTLLCSARLQGNSDSNQLMVRSGADAFRTGKTVLLASCDANAATGEPIDIIACPLKLNGTPYGSVTLCLKTRTQAARDHAVRQIEEGAVWYSTLLKQSPLAGHKQLVDIVELVATCLEYDTFSKAATDVATDLADRLSCEKICIGFVKGSSVSVQAISHTSRFDQKTSVVKGIGEAMLEAIDQSGSVCYPPGEDDFLITRCHRALVNGQGERALLTVPFSAGTTPAGAILAERTASKPFSGAEKKHLEHIASMIGPVLHTRYRDEQMLHVRIGSTIKEFSSRLLGRSHPGLKLLVLASMAALILLSTISVDYRVEGDARLESLTQQVVVAPLDGFIARSDVRPGDLIKKGAPLGRLEDKDLVLEHQKWSNQREQLHREYRDALAKHERAQINILNARIRKTEAQLNLVERQLERIHFKAPFDGYIVSGDLTRAVGSPVNKGQVLFTLAPLLEYMVILEIDERDIGTVKVGQQGKLVLSAMPGTPIDFAVKKITPVSVAEEGRNYFLAEAAVAENSDLLRPGMEGVGKIEIEKRKLIWVLTHNLTDWLRMAAWSLLP